MSFWYAQAGSGTTLSSDIALYQDRPDVAAARQRGQHTQAAGVHRVHHHNVARLQRRRQHTPYIGGEDLPRHRPVQQHNVPLHRTSGVREALEGLGATVPEFPAYSPDFNPIEQPIGKLKSVLRKLAPRSIRSLTAGVRKGLKQFSPAECAAYLRHAGYGRPKQKMV